MSGVLNILLAQGPQLSGGTRYVATLSSATTNILISDDAVNWQLVNTGVSEYWNTVIYMSNVNRFVIVGGFSGAIDNIIYSDDGGLTWTGTTTPVTASFSDGGTLIQRTALYNPTLEVAVAAGNRGGVGINRIFYSSDGINWSQGAYASGASDHIIDLAFRPSDGAMVGVGTSFASLFRKKYYSSDGITWNSDGTTSGSSQFDSAVYIPGNDRFVVLEPNRYAYTDDAGVTYPVEGASSPAPSSAVKWSMENPFSAGEIILSDNTGNIYTSTDFGANLTLRETFAQRVTAIVYNGTTLFGVGDGALGTGRVVSSTDGAAWAEEAIISVGGDGFYGLALATNHPFDSL